MFYQLSDPTQNVPEGYEGWIEQLKQEKIICDCWNIIKHKPIDVFLNEIIKKSFAPISYVRGTFIGMLRKDIVSLFGLQNIENVYYAGKVYDINKNLSKEYISVVPKGSTYVVVPYKINLCHKIYFMLPEKPTENK
ncbi:hypothetical protein, partial [Tannerella forsythia]|uniref:hypothetical protein n=1 Tax=Tannerella forsythia TaxID=28112 RepID=UPI001C89ADB8